MATINTKLILAIGEDWYNLLGDQFSANYMNKLSMRLLQERKEHVVHPASEEVFNVYKLIKPQDVRVVILGQDPYPDGSYSGMAFSNPKGRSWNKVSPSLKNIFKEIDIEFNYGNIQHHNPDLTRWANQGVFLLNTILTVRDKAPLSHAEWGWEYFTSCTIKRLSENYPSIVYMLWGNNAKSYEKYIKKENNLIILTSHPSPLAVHSGGWFHTGIFMRCNEFLKQNNKQEIKWVE
jgi:uracil-DNA glycosylase